ncbi:hypothetical protein YC2023_035651 [Brassica napus]
MNPTGERTKNRRLLRVLKQQESSTAGGESQLKTKTRRQRRLHNLNREVEGLSLQYSELQNSSVQEKIENE